MGREIRPVPDGWEHPTEEKPNYHRTTMETRFKPLFDRSYEEACAEWWKEAQAWQAGERPDYAGDDSPKWYWDWNGSPPDVNYYRPEWADEERTHFQIYETVSEGTPCSPVFATLAEVADWMCQPIDRVTWPQYNRGKDWQCSQGKTREQAEAFTKVAWAPSGVIIGGQFQGGIEGLAAMAKDTKA
jgi:hypothetical protein